LRGTYLTLHSLLPDILEGRIHPGLVFDRTIGLDQVPAGYRAMNERQVLKIMMLLCGNRSAKCGSIPSPAGALILALDWS